MDRALLLSIVLLYLVCNSDARCPNGFIRYYDKCYFFSRGERSWMAAHWTCKSFGGYLVEIDSSLENSFLTGRLSFWRYKSRYGYWIGLTDVANEGMWMWEHANCPARYTNWQRHQPVYSWHQNCAQILYNGYWDDLQCSIPRRYICEADD